MIKNRQFREIEGEPRIIFGFIVRESHANFLSKISHPSHAPGQKKNREIQCVGEYASVNFPPNKLVLNLIFLLLSLLGPPSPPAMCTRQRGKTISQKIYYLNIIDFSNAKCTGNSGQFCHATYNSHKNSPPSFIFSHLSYMDRTHTN